MELIGRGIFACVFLLFGFLGIAVLIQLGTSGLRRLINQSEQGGSQPGSVIFWLIFGLIAFAVTACYACQAIFGGIF